MEGEIRYGSCNNSLAEWQPQKWMAPTRVTDTQSSLLHGAPMSRRAWGEGVAVKLLANV